MPRKKAPVQSDESEMTIVFDREREKFSLQRKDGGKKSPTMIGCCLTDPLRELVRQARVERYSPKVLVGDWPLRNFKLDAIKPCHDPDCGLCVDLRGSYDTWKPDVVLRRQVRLRDYRQLQDPSGIFCRDRENDGGLYAKELKSLYDQTINDRFYPADVDWPHLLPDGPTCFGLRRYKEAQWREEQEQLSTELLQLGPTHYRDTFRDWTPMRVCCRERLAAGVPVPENSSSSPVPPAAHGSPPEGEPGTAAGTECQCQQQASNGCCCCCRDESTEQHHQQQHQHQQQQQQQLCGCSSSSPPQQQPEFCPCQLLDS